MKKKPRESHAGNWMDTYGDMVTLLLCFFVLLFSMSTVEEVKWRALVQSFKGNHEATVSDIIANNSEVGPLNPDNTGGNADELPQTIGDLYKYLEEKVVEPSKGEITMTQDENGDIHITFSDNTLFQANRYTILDDAKPFLNLVGQALKNVEDKLTLVEAAGYVADTGNPNSVVNDWYLSSNRAAAVINYLSDNHNIKNQLLVTIGHGINNPVGDNKTEEGRRKNRRVVLTIVGNDENVLTSAASGQNYDKTRYPAGGNGVSPYQD